MLIKILLITIVIELAVIAWNTRRKSVKSLFLPSLMKTVNETLSDISSSKYD